MRLPGRYENLSIEADNAYCIDKSEVSFKDYDAFYTADPSGPTFTPAPFCDWNTDYTPTTWPPPAAKYLRPVTGVDWCDAYAYCAYVEKRLCGKIGGGTADFGSFDDPAVSEWHNACTTQGNNLYPYGDVYNPDTCNGAEDDPAIPTPETVDVEDAQGNPIVSLCAGGFTFMYQMSGNASEWEDSCDGATGPNYFCHVRSGIGDIGRHDENGDATPGQRCLAGRDRLAPGLLGRDDHLTKHTAALEHVVEIDLLDRLEPNVLPHDLGCDQDDGRAVAIGLVEAVDEVEAAGAAACRRRP